MTTPTKKKSAEIARENALQEALRFVRRYRFDLTPRTDQDRARFRKLKSLVKSGRGIGKDLAAHRTLFGSNIEGKRSVRAKAQK